MSIWTEIKHDIIERKKFEFIDHSIETQLQGKQRCGHCGKIFPLNERGIGGIITINEIIVLCRDCNDPYRRETWTEKNIRSATESLAKVRKNSLDDWMEEIA